MVQKLILVTGATGYIASRLIPRLLDCGHRVRALARDPLRLKGRSWFRQIEVFQGDVMIPSTLEPALQDVDTAYYLIHNMSAGHGYTIHELDGAHNFTSAAGDASIQHIIYLGGLADPEQHIAPHMRSRIETGVVLRQGKVPVTEFRAGVIAGSGSISFEMIRFMTELFPIIPGPTWLKNKTQPIAIQNIIDYLLAALENKTGQDGVFEIGGPEITTYMDLMSRYANLRGLRRRFFLLPYIPIELMAFGIGLMTPVPRPIARALVGGLSSDSIVQHHEAQKFFPEVKLTGFNSAVQDALEKTHPSFIERIWDERPDFGSLSGGISKGRVFLKTSEVHVKSIKHEGFFIVHQGMQINASPEKVFQAVTNTSTNQTSRSETNDSEKTILQKQHNSFGNKFMEWRVSQASSRTYITQTVFFAPRGLPGFLYWYLLYPFHIFVFRGLMRAIARKSLPLPMGEGRGEGEIT